MSGHAPRIGERSPDGLSWWDGTAWRSVPQPAAAPAPPPFPPPLAPPPMSPSPQFPPPSPPAPHLMPPGAAPRAKGRRRPGKVVAVLIAVSALLLGACPGGTAGVLAGYLWVEPTGPTTPPAMAADFPHGDQRYLPGVTVRALADDWLKKENSYTCAAAAKAEASGAKQRLDCEGPGELSLEVSVHIEYDDDTHVRYVAAFCRFDPGANYCRSLFSGFGYKVFEDKPELRQQAQDWGAKNVDSDNVTTIGGVTLLVSLKPHHIRAMPAS
ncbi:hypothetical protein [Micromonospora sp. CPCC 206061]|uniref:hypothetical protein n=1 Tax=Micromonospora sp. CPCC 206061 TaxID=3122410 RepID=UPI002FEEF6BD